jgi:hypothetical protein
MGAPVDVSEDVEPAEGVDSAGSTRGWDDVAMAVLMVIRVLVS